MSGFHGSRFGLSNAPERLHEILSEITVAEHEVPFERFHVFNEMVLIEKHIEQTLACYAICCINGAFKPIDVAILEGYSRMALSPCYLGGMNETNPYCSICFLLQPIRCRDSYNG